MNPFESFFKRPVVKVSPFDARVRDVFYKYTSAISTVLSLVVLFLDIPAEHKITLGRLLLWLLIVIYYAIWCRSNGLQKVDIKIEESDVTVKVGDIFAQPGLKAIAFNECFDTIVDERLVASATINGQFLNRLPAGEIANLDQHIESYGFESGEILGEPSTRAHGKKKRFQIGTICVYKNEYLLTAFSRFDDNYKAVLTMPEYLEFLINFWDRVNNIYALRSVSTPIFGSGITRIKGHRSISDEDLLKIMLWTFRISEMRFRYPARLTIVIHKDKIGKINLLDIKAARNGV